MDPAAQIIDILAGGVKTKVVYVLCRIGFFDKLPVGQTKKLEQLAEECEVAVYPLQRILRMASQIGLVSEHQDGYTTTEVGAVLSSGHPSHLRGVAMTMNLPIHDRSFGCLYEAVKDDVTGLSVAYKDPNVNIFDLFAKDPLEMSVFEEAMMGATALGIETVLSYDWSQYSSMADVGGNVGTVVQVVLDKYPTISKGLNVDRADVIATLPEPSGALAGRLRNVVGDFFKPLPEDIQGVDAIVLKHIMHDWGFDRCVTIMKNCVERLAPGGHLIVIDYIIPETANVAPGAYPIWPFVLDMVMMAVNPGGCERTMEEWGQLFSAAGLNPPELMTINKGLGLLRATPRAP